MQKSGRKRLLSIGVYRKMLKLQKTDERKRRNPHINELVKQEEPSLLNSGDVTASTPGAAQGYLPHPHSVC